MSNIMLKTITCRPIESVIQRLL